MYIMNSIGLRTDPCGILLVIGAQSETNPLITTLCFLLLNQREGERERWSEGGREWERRRKREREREIIIIIIIIIKLIPLAVVILVTNNNLYTKTLKHLE